MRPLGLPLLTNVEPPELLVHDEQEACPYLPDQQARFPLRLPIRRLSPEELDARLAEGDRRHGTLLYRPSCGECSACEAIRVDVPAFELSRSHRRVLRRAERELQIEWGPPRADAEAIALYDQHRFGRNLAREGAKAISARSYEQFLVERCCDVQELRVRDAEGTLLAVAIVDHGATSLSAVYTHYDPAAGHYSLGTLAILLQMQRAKETGRRWLYLGLYVGGCSAMEYKARYRPHERLVDGAWRRFDAE